MRPHLAAVGVGVEPTLDFRLASLANLCLAVRPTHQALQLYQNSKDNIRRVRNCDERLNENDIPGSVYP